MTVVELNGAGSARRPTGRSKSGIVAALDIGSTKISCLIAKPDRKCEQTGLRVLGSGYHAADGIRCGAVVDLDRAERSIRLAVDAAERMAQCSIGEVYVNISGGRPISLALYGVVEVEDEAVTGHDMDRAVAAAMKQMVTGGRILLHATPVDFDLDDARGVVDPRGLFGRRLGVHVNAVLVEPGAMRNLSLAIERCHLKTAGFVLSPYAAARALLVPDELALGVTLIDMGGETTSLAVFADGKLVHGDVLPVGGAHVTRDLARGLSTTIAHAERMKVLYGSALPSAHDDRELISVPLLGETGVDTLNKVPRSMLTGIIRPRLEEIMELVRDRLEGSPVAHRLERRVVISGGASQLNGLAEAASLMLGRQVRVASPLKANGRIQSSNGPAFGVSLGLLQFALNPDEHTASIIEMTKAVETQSGYLNRVGRWIRESF